MRRSVEDGVKHRFVTGDRLEALLKVKVTPFGYTLSFFSEL
jgi:hypothetical protein